MNDPFAALAVAARPDLTDEEVRAAWKRIAAATHPDREDGGDAARYAVAAAAYDALRTSFGRGEALADLGLTGAAPRTGAGNGGGVGRSGWRLALRAAAAVGVTTAAVLAAGWTPGTVGASVGALTWAAVASRHNLTRRGDWLRGVIRGTVRSRRGGWDR